MGKPRIKHTIRWKAVILYFGNGFLPQRMLGLRCSRQVIAGAAWNTLLEPFQPRSFFPVSTRMNSTPENDSDLQNASSASPTPTFPLVGLGASAGGIQALQTFFENMPNQSGMAFVVIMHLSPNHESNLASILQHRTSMPVLQVTEPTRVAPNHVYVIPPSKHLLLQDGHIEVVEPQQATGKRLAVDLFFRTLSASYGPRRRGGRPLGYG